MAYETLEETRQWLKEQEEKEGITYSERTFHMALSNGESSPPDYEALAKTGHASNQCVSFYSKLGSETFA